MYLFSTLGGFILKKVILVLCVTLALCALASCGAGTREYDVLDYRTTMEYYEGFKIMQIADLHFGIESDLRSQMSVVEKSVLEADPDLIILTGDNLMYGNKAIANELFGLLNSLCKRLTEADENGRLTKFAVTYGNHDNQGDYPRYYLNNTIKSYVAEDGKEKEEGKFAAFVDYEDDNLFGLTNYYIDLVDDRTKDRDTVDVKYRIHIIDSNTYHYTGIKYGYDTIHTEQLLHAKKIYDEATADKDYVGMMFFHIPFEEFGEAEEQYILATDPSKIGQGELREPVSDPYENNGSFKALREANIVSYFVGHDHVNSCDIIYNKGEAFENMAIFSYGVKSTDQVYHDKDMLGYKTVTLKDLTPKEFVTIENINDCFENVRTGAEKYE